MDIKEATTESLRKLIGVVTQDSILFNDSVQNNLLIGNPNATDEEVIEAAKIANAHEFIITLSEGYHTNIGDQGNKLSGGQKQRLSIARALLSKPRFLILDDCFPRSLAFCHSELRANLAALARLHGREGASNTLMRDADTRIADLTIEDVFEQGLHEFLVDFMASNAAIGVAIAKDYRFLA